MGTVLPVPVCVVGKSHRLHNDDAILDGVLRLRPEDEVRTALKETSVEVISYRGHSSTR